MSKSLFKRIGTSVVALSLVISSLSAVTVSAEDSSDFHPSVTYAKGDYTFGKLSHPDKPVSTPDGIVDYLGSGNVAVTGENGATGQGDQGQSYAWSAASYGDWMYVGTCYAAMGNTLELMDTILGDNFDPEIMRAALKAMFNGTFFYGHEKADGTLDEDSGGILVKVNVKTGETKLLGLNLQLVKDRFSEMRSASMTNFISAVLSVRKDKGADFLASTVSILKQMRSTVCIQESLQQKPELHTKKVSAQVFVEWQSSMVNSSQAVLV